MDPSISQVGQHPAPWMTRFCVGQLAVAFLRRGKLEEQMLQDLLARKAEEEQSIAALKYPSLPCTGLQRAYRCRVAVLASLKQLQHAESGAAEIPVSTPKSSKSPGTSDRELRRWRDKVTHLMKSLEKAKVRLARAIRVLSASTQGEVVTAEERASQLEIQLREVSQRELKLRANARRSPREPSSDADSTLSAVRAVFRSTCGATL